MDHCFVLLFEELQDEMLFRMRLLEDVEQLLLQRYETQRLFAVAGLPKQVGGEFRAGDVVVAGRNCAAQIFHAIFAHVGCLAHRFE